MVRLLDMGHLLVNLKLLSMVNNHPWFLPLVSKNQANLALVSSRNKSQLRLSRVGKGG